MDEDFYPDDVVKELVKLGPERQQFLRDVVSECMGFNAQDDPLFRVLTITTYDSAPPDVRGVSKKTYDKILGMGFDLGRAYGRMEHERPSD